jgi:hypothetical protein
LPPAVSARVCVTRTNPFCTAMPKSPINPTSPCAALLPLRVKVCILSLTEASNPPRVE